MRRTPHILLTSLLGVLGAQEALAQGAPLDARNIKPAVMLLVDTSGSMERLPATATTDETPLPTCTGNTTQDSLQKNRWALTLEALTGSFQNFTCREIDRSSSSIPSTDYDFGYYLPHIDFGTSPSQNTDGLMDSFANRVKFGLMTFDGVATTINGETLVEYDVFTTPEFLDQANSGPGLYSYGDVKRLSFPGCFDDYGVNAGARGPGSHPGALISVGASENADDILAVNATIQSSLLGVRPFGGTPIPAMLDDLRFYLERNSDINEAGDRFYQCRVRTAILITDGAPDALFRDSRFQCEQTEDSGAHATCAPPRDDAGTDDAGVAADGGHCECPYDQAHEIARDLLERRLLDKLIVVAYNVQNPEALRLLEQIAFEGWPKDSAGQDRDPALGTPPEYPYLVRANGPDELRNLLNTSLRGDSSGVTSRSVPISVNTGDAVTGPDSKRFDITAGFELGEDEDQPWRGYLYRRRVTCDATTVNDQVTFDAAEGDEFHTSLNQQTTRDLFTVTPQSTTYVNGTLRNTAYRPAPVYSDSADAVHGDDAANFDPTPLPTGFPTRNLRWPDGSTISTSQLIPTDSSVTTSQSLASTSISARVNFDNGLDPLLFGGATTDAQRQRIVAYVRGDSRADRKLADIYHSNPIALLPLNSASTTRFADINGAYSDWLRKIIVTSSGARYGVDGRPGIVFVGTNDGVLHAFNLDDWESGSRQPHAGGDELWGFVPPALFGKMGAAAAPAHQFMFDGTPEVKDVVLQDGRNTPPIFRTVLLAALRGAPAFVALDVTFPEEPVFLWQFTLPDIGETVGNPALTQVEVDWEGERMQRAVAILPGGRGVASSSCAAGSYVTPVAGQTRAAFPLGGTRNVRCWQRRGRGLYVVDVSTGQLLQEFGPEHFPSPLTGSVVVDSAGVGTASAAYVFDHDGVLWRLSMVGPDPSQWVAAPIFDMFEGVPLATGLQSWQAGRVPQYAPTLTRDRQGNLVILAGTGDADNPLDTATQRVVSLTEKREPGQYGQISGSMVLNWWRDLDPNESVTGPLTVFENVVYFGTFISQATSNQCGLGVSYKYGAHAFDPDPQPLDARPGPPWPKLIASDADPGDAPVLRERVAGNSLILGMTVTRQPTCRVLGAPNPITGQVTGGATGGGLYQLRAMMSGGSSGGRTGGGAIKELEPTTIPASYPSSMSSWAGAVE